VLSPQRVRQLIREEEIPLRARSLPAETVARIFDYGAPIGSRIECHDRLARGMERARDLIRQTEEAGKSFASGTAILACELTAGRGRFQRVWHAPPGGVWLTLILVNTLLPAAFRLYPLAAGLASCETLRSYGLPARLKWVNDVQVNGRKIAGVLTETLVGVHSGEEYVLIGVGLNANNDSFPPELAETAVAMKTCLAAEVDIELLAGRLLAKLAWNIGLLHYAEQELLDAEALAIEAWPAHPLIAGWLSLSDMVGRRVAFGYDVQKNPLYEARVTALEPLTGGLILALADGSTITEYSGEIVYLD